MNYGHHPNFPTTWEVYKTVREDSKVQVRGKCPSADKHLSGSKRPFRLPDVRLKFSLRRFIGHFIIIEQINNVAFTIEKQAGLRIRNVFNISLFRPYIEGKSPEVIKSEQSTMKSQKNP